MSGSANVRSVEVIQRLREAICAYGSEGRDALSSVDMQVRRAFDWLAHQTKSWQVEIRKRQEAVQKAKLELEQRKFENRDGKGRGDTEQRINLRKAQERLKEAELKFANCKRWLPELQHAAMEYQGFSRSLATALETDLKHAVALLDQKLDALNAYLKLQAPSAPVVPPDVTTEPTVVAAQASPSATLPNEAPGTGHEPDREHERGLRQPEPFAEDVAAAVGRSPGGME